MSSYTTVFGATTVIPNASSWSSYSFSADFTLSWPNDIAGNSNLATAIIELIPSTIGLSVTMPDATEVSVGQAVVFNNQGGSTCTIKDNAGNTLLSLATGLIWTLYVADNSTVAGVWRAYQNGAGTSTVNAAGLAGLGIRAIGASLNQSMPVTTSNSNYAPSTTDRAKVFKWTGGAGIYTLPLAATVGDDWFIVLRNSGSGTLTLTPSGANTINGASSLALATTESLILVCDGTTFFTIGYGRSVSGTFALLPINVAGTGNYTLSVAEQSQVGYLFTGLLTGNRNIIVPNTVAQYWVDNQCTGAFTLTVKTAAGTGITIPTGNRYILYCDGTNVVQADTLSASYPVSVANGGTGAVTAGSALTNLGGTAIGTAVFTAASLAAAQTTLGIVPTTDQLSYTIALS